MEIHERHREDRVGWAHVEGIIIRGCIPERTEVSDETVGTSWCRGEELLRACRVRAVRCLNDIRFVIKVFASDIAQQPLKHLFD